METVRQLDPGLLFDAGCEQEFQSRRSERLRVGTRRSSRIGGDRRAYGLTL